MRKLTQDECYRLSRQLRAINDALPSPVLLEAASYFEGYAFDLGRGEPCCIVHPNEQTVTYSGKEPVMGSVPKEATDPYVRLERLEKAVSRLQRALIQSAAYLAAVDQVQNDA